ncbi:hypothetical protein AB0I84_05935 [Streptomyces spectabilis]|uniref:hypothetical protein n=1 Tax=Streptomyces spectabilis TaxID=68270 RepID=UPI0033F1B678
MSDVPTTVQWLRTAGVRIYTGSGRLTIHLGSRAATRARALCTRLRDWLGRSSGLKWCLKVGALIGAAVLARKIGAAVLGSVYVRVESGAWAPLLWITALAWTIAAYCAGRPGWEPKTPAAVAEKPDDTPASEDEAPTKAGAEQPPAGPPSVSPVALVAAVRDIGTPHAQLRPLAEHLGTTTDAVRAAAAALGWPVKDVRMEGRSASAGLRWDEGPSPDRAYPSRGVVGAGQRADDNDDDSPEEGPREGLRVEDIGHGGRLVTDPTETIRHHKVRGH